MDERKNVKVIDEHSIDREAKTMCSIDVDGTDYVVYSINRGTDSDEENLFVSKLIKNNDGTSSMVNIDDSSEKAKLADIVKELVTYAINNEADKTTGVVELKDGKKINISGVIFNKEQNINVSKTYITTVKRAVTKVCGTFYNVEVPKAEPVVESVFDTPNETNDVFPEVAVEAPVQQPVVAETPVAEQVAAAPVVEPILPEMPVPTETVPSVEATAPEKSVSQPMTPEPVLPPVEQVAAPVQPPVVEPILPEVPVASAPVEAVPSVASQPLENNAAAQIMTPAQEETVTPPISVVEPVPTPVVQATVPSEPVPAVENQLVFDGSKETNLNTALGEVSKDNILPVEDVTPIREFGQDEPAMSVPEVGGPVVEKPTGPVLTRKAGFANNKFFMVIAIAFFLAACVFLGYEVFRYFKIVG